MGRDGEGLPCGLWGFEPPLGTFVAFQRLVQSKCLPQVWPFLRPSKLVQVLWLRGVHCCRSHAVRLQITLPGNASYECVLPLECVRKVTLVPRATFSVLYD